MRVSDANSASVAARELKVGDTVLWTPNWGSGIPREAVVECIDQTNGGEKFGIPVESVLWGTEFVVNLDNDHWAYSYALAPKGSSDE